MNEENTTFIGETNGTQDIESTENVENPFKTEEKPKRDEKGLFLPGTAPGPGRPKGKTLKEWMKDKLTEMTIEEREEFLKEIPKEMQWRMAEGNPSSDDKVHQTVKIIIASEDEAIPPTNPDTEGQS